MSAVIIYTRAVGDISWKLIILCAYYYYYYDIIRCFHRRENINNVFIDGYYNINIYDSIEFKYRLDAYNAKGR